MSETAAYAHPALEPVNDYNRKLQDNVHPSEWQNPTPSGRYNLVVIGAGTAGLVTAAGAAGLGAKVALIERDLMGGDCLNVGCVPSKALISSARRAADVQRAESYGITTDKPDVDFSAVMDRMRRIRAGISPHDSAQRFSELGIDVYLGNAQFTGPDTVEVGGQTLHFARAAIATGARAAELPIPGLSEVDYLTNETVFSLTERPEHLAVIGAGPIGCELAQTFQRLGTQVTLIEAEPRILPREDDDAARVVEAAMKRDGVTLICGGKTLSIEQGDAGEKRLNFECEGEQYQVAVDQILLGVGRAPNVESLNLEAADVKYDKTGVQVNDYLQTSNRRIYAAGDVASKYKFTHAADAMARIVIQNALFFGRAKASALTVPWCTYTEPELAHVGLNSEQAKAHDRHAQTIEIAMSELDRAQLEGHEEGFLRVHVDKKARIFGATVVGHHGGELIAQIVTAMTAGQTLGALAKVIHPYPTHSEIVKKAADAYQRQKLTPTVKRLFERFLSLRR
jgi:pyruvate/2-oxoglutarate dehydrogenase complex dihydrolipoamide dehydrogenase (E3) component